MHDPYPPVPPAPPAPKHDPLPHWLASRAPPATVGPNRPDSKGGRSDHAPLSERSHRDPRGLCRGPCHRADPRAQRDGRERRWLQVRARAGPGRSRCTIPVRRAMSARSRRLRSPRQCARGTPDSWRRSSPARGAHSSSSGSYTWLCGRLLPAIDPVPARALATSLRVSRGVRTGNPDPGDRPGGAAPQSPTRAAPGNGPRNGSGAHGVCVRVCQPDQRALL